jgi:DnaJ-class molecular chaperone
MPRRYHPDKNRGSKEAEAKFIKIQQAYEVLKDEKQRRAYDAVRKYSSSRTPPRGAQQPGDGQQGDAFSRKSVP